MKELFKKGMDNGWGLRGDSELWREMSEFIPQQTLPESVSDFKLMLESAFETLTGYNINHEGIVYVQKYDKGGMSAGQVSTQLWKEKAFPILIERFKEFLSKNKAAKGEEYKRLLQEFVDDLYSFRKGVNDKLFLTAMAGELSDLSRKLKIGDTLQLKNADYEAMNDQNIQKMYAFRKQIEETIDSLSNLNNLEHPLDKS